MSIAATLPTYLPYVRRFARTLTSSQAFGDQYALAALEAAAANPGAVGEDPDGSVWMYRRLLEIWLDNGAPSSQDVLDVPGSQDEGGPQDGQESPKAGWAQKQPPPPLRRCRT